MSFELMLSIYRSLILLSSFFKKLAGEIYFVDSFKLFSYLKLSSISYNLLLFKID